MPLDMMNDIRSMDAGGVPWAEITRRLGVSRNTAAKYADTSTPISMTADALSVVDAFVS